MNTFSIFKRSFFNDNTIIIYYNTLLTSSLFKGKPHTESKKPENTEKDTLHQQNLKFHLICKKIKAPFVYFGFVEVKNQQEIN